MSAEDRLLPADELPDGFEYPEEFLRIVERGLLYFEPWWVIEGDQLRVRAQGMAERYPDRRLVPFARREDSDDVACFEQGKGQRVQLVHDFASPGYEQRGELDSVGDWLRLALETMLEFDADASSDD
jgi:hypothetical protein